MAERNGIALPPSAWESLWERLQALLPPDQYQEVRQAYTIDGSTYGTAMRLARYVEDLRKLPGRYRGAIGRSDECEARRTVKNMRNRVQALATAGYGKLQEVVAARQFIADIEETERRRAAP